MTADNWAVCPRCEARRQAVIKEAEVGVATAYGKVPVEEWDELRAATDALKAVEPRCTFREDYEFYGVEEGALNVSYRGGCQECGLTHSFEHSEPLGVTP